MTDRVHFFSSNDLSAYHYLQKATPVIEAYSEGKVYADVNDVIELYHIRKFVDNGITLKDWDEEFVAKTNDFSRIVSAFFKGIKPDKLPKVYDAVEFEYRKTFWEIIDAFDIKGVLNEDNLRVVCQGDKFTLRDILGCGRIVKCHSKTLVALLKENDRAAEWILDHYVAKRELTSGETIEIPEALTIQDKEDIISRYLDGGEEVNLNYVQLVINAKDEKKKLVISPKLRLKAQKMEQELVRQYFKPGMGVPMRTTVEMSREEGIDPVSTYNDEDGFVVCKYDAKLIDTLDYPDLVYYFQYVFEYLNKLSFINLISMSSQEGVMERLMGLTAKDTYRENIDFKVKDQLAVIQMTAMITTLKHTGRRVEDAIKFFYEEHLKGKYGYPAQKITIPSESGSFVEKFRALAPELDAIVKQYNLYTKEREIDPELLAVESSIKITDSASCVDRKYYVVNENCGELGTVLDLLFGDQSMLFYVKPYEDEHYTSFFSLLKAMKTIDCRNYEQWQMPKLQFLIDKGLVKIGENSMLDVTDWPKILVLQHLYKYRACTFYYYPEDMQRAVLEMADAGWLSCSKKLLTPEEQNYFSFILNNERFTNAYAIRNHYAHGNNGSADDERLHEIAYTRLLIMFVLLLLKIDDDLAIMQALGGKTVKNFQQI